MFFVFLIVGVVAAVVFDTLRATEKVAFSGRFFFVLKDILFWIITTFLIFFICLKYNDGEIRFYMFMAVLIGAMVYFKTLSIFIVKILCALLEFVKKIVYLILKVVFIPLRLINKPVFIAFSFSKRGIVNMGKRISFKMKILKKFKRKH